MSKGSRELDERHTYRDTEVSCMCQCVGKGLLIMAGQVLVVVMLEITESNAKFDHYVPLPVAAPSGAGRQGPSWHALPRVAVRILVLLAISTSRHGGYAGRVRQGRVRRHLGRAEGRVMYHYEVLIGRGELETEASRSRV